MSQQLPLIPLPEIDYSHAAFIPFPSHEKALHLVERCPDWPTAWSPIEGESGSGKTHLARIWGGEELTRQQLDSWLSQNHVPQKRFCLNVSQDMAPDLLFHVLNQAKNQQLLLLLLSHPGAIWHLTPDLPDLTSRLKQALYERIDQPNDQTFRGLLMKNLKDVDYDIAPQAIAYLEKRIPRSYVAIQTLMMTLRQGIQAGHYPLGQKLTIAALQGRFSSIVEGIQRDEEKKRAE
ncbi:hypothetical protein OAN22_01965 [Alphaproteobacteria bacterium]|nr:hypothetical protein [Alphaproteobacteria bacterium]